MKRIFVSYDYDNDKHYKNLLVAWSANKSFDLIFDDASADVSIKSNDETVIKRAISAKINNANYFLCLIGGKTHRSNWVIWEIKKALELNKKIVAVKIDNQNLSPYPILGIGASIAKSFAFESIKNAIDNA